MSSNKIHKDGYLELFQLLGVLGRKRYMFAAPYLNFTKFNPTEARLLTLIVQQGRPISQDELSSKIFLDRTNVGRGLKRLEDLALVKRVRDEKDKRANMIIPTASAKREVAKLNKIRAQAAHDFLGHLSESEANSLLKYIKKALKDEE